MASALDDLASRLRPGGWPALSTADARRVRALAWLAIAAQALFVAGWIAGWLLEPGYSPIRNYVSELGRRGAANPWIFDASMAIWGAGFFALALAMAYALRARPCSRVTAALFALAGACAIACAPLRLDCATTMSHVCKTRTSAGTLSWHHYGHMWAALGVQLALFLTPLALARATWPSTPARVLLYGAIAVAVPLGLSWLIDFEGEGLAGLWQRAELSIAHVWVLLCAAALILEADRASPATEPRASAVSGAASMPAS